MKPDWEALGDAYAGSSSVVIGDADCTVEKDLCSKAGVSGYPTIKYYTAETGSDGEGYQGGRDKSSLTKFVEEKLAKKCDIADESSCDEKELKYMKKITDSGKDVAKELARLEGMKGNSMKAELKGWLFQRISILEQMSQKAEL